MGGFSDSVCWILQRLADFTVRGHINIFNTFPFVTASPRLLFWPRFTVWGKKDGYRTNRFVNLVNDLQQAPSCNLTIEVVRFGVNNVYFQDGDGSHAFVFTVELTTNYLRTWDLRQAYSSPQGPQTRMVFCPNRQKILSPRNRASQVKVKSTR